MPTQGCLQPPAVAGIALAVVVDDDAVLVKEPHDGVRVANGVVDLLRDNDHLSTQQEALASQLVRAATRVLSY
jgi:hypothetical protein